MEEGNNDSTVRRDGPAAAKAKETTIDNARAALVQTLTAEQQRIPPEHQDWIALENMKEDILRESNVSVLSAKLKFLSELLEALSGETLVGELKK